MEVISSVHKGAAFVAAGAAVRRRVGQFPAAGIIAVMTRVDGSINVKTLIPVGGVQTAPAGIYVDLSGVQPRPGMSIRTKNPDRYAISNPVVNTDAHASGREIIPFYAVIIIDIYPIAPAVHPYAPAVGGTRYEGRRNNLFFPTSLPVGAGGGAGATGETNPVEPL